MIYITNPLILPLFILIWSADAWLWLVSIRLIIGRFAPCGRLLKVTQSFTDPVPEYIDRLISRMTGKTLNSGFLWLISIVSLVLLRCLILQIIITNSIRRY